MKDLVSAELTRLTHDSPDNPTLPNPPRPKSKRATFYDRPDLIRSRTLSSTLRSSSFRFSSSLPMSRWM